MHIPDGFLDIFTVIFTYAIFIGYSGFALKKARKTLYSEQVSLVSIVAAAIFVAQMLNWPLPGGTSLHLVGGALAGIMLGPWLGFLTMFLVLLIQCIVFHDGGITALGANTLNMAIVDVLVGYLIYTGFIKLFGAKNSVRTLSAFLGGWLGITLAGLACGLEIGYSQSFPYGVVITVPVMVGWHAILGVIEGVITALVVTYLAGRAPHLILSEKGGSS
ncbi:MAG: energy-coupling factor ABC transporter permease [Candidatus Bathyarchaeota archaeon]